MKVCDYMKFRLNKKEDENKKVKYKNDKKNLKIKNSIKEKKKKSRNKSEKKESKIYNFLMKLKKKFPNLWIFSVDNNGLYNFKEVVIIMLFSLGVGFFTCFSFVMVFNNGRDYKALTKKFSKLIDTYYTIKENYYGDLDEEALVDSAIKGMVESVGDVYTSYSDSDTAENFMETVSGVYEGIGCTVAMTIDSQIIVIDMFEDSPAKEAGLQINDIIVKIDGEDYVGKTSSDMSSYIKKSKNSEVKLTVIREEEEVEIIIKRKKIEIPYVTSNILEKNDKKVGYITIELFSSVTHEQFEKNLLKLEKDGIDSLIIDVRGNNGGYLSSVTEIIDLFLEKGKIIYKLEDKSGVVVNKDTTKEKRDYPVAILVNRGSASASEILAAAIKESYKGYVVGTNTYGKGTVQQTTTLPDGSMVKYTIQKWLTPDGNWINEVGLEPTDFIELDESYFENPVIDNDVQLQKALELVTK